jgi:hypothetical protein
MWREIRATNGGTSAGKGRRSDWYGATRQRAPDLFAGRAIRMGSDVPCPRTESDAAAPATRSASYAIVPHHPHVFVLEVVAVIQE